MRQQSASRGASQKRDIKNQDIQSLLAAAADSKTSSLMDKTTAFGSEYRRKTSLVKGSKRTSMNMSLTRPFSNMSMIMEDDGLEDLHFTSVAINVHNKKILEKYEQGAKEQKQDDGDNLVEYFKEEIELLN